MKRSRFATALAFALASGLGLAFAAAPTPKPRPTPDDDSVMIVDPSIPAPKKTPRPARTPVKTPGSGGAAHPGTGPGGAVSPPTGALPHAPGRVLTFDAMRIEGRIQKPQAIDLLERSRADFGDLEPDEDFVPKIERSVEKDPF